MKVYIANFGRENYEWPTCHARGTVATMNEISVQPFWEAGDREAYIQKRMLGKTAAGINPTRPVASRWFNLMTIISQTSGDIWIHRQKDEIWWTKSRSGPPMFEEKVEPIERGNHVVICHKSCNKWSNSNHKGNRLEWGALHPRAKEFLFTESTLQALSSDNSEYALALIAGEDLSPWHERLAWKKKLVAYAGKGGPAAIYNSLQKSAYRMASQAFDTAQYSNGQEIKKILKNKNVDFSSQYILERYIIDIYKLQEGLCALTELPMQLDGEDNDRELRCSLDRINSDGHYQIGNLQIVCRFANRWKSSGDDSEFRRLINVIRSSKSTDDI